MLALKSTNMLKDNYITGLKMQVSDFDVFNIINKFELLFYIEYASVTVVTEYVTSVTMVIKSITIFIDV